MSREEKKDLAVLVPDKNIEYAVKGILSRPESLAIDSIIWNCFVHHERDPGCLKDSHNFLRSMIREYNHAAVILDRHGCGKDQQNREEIERSIEGNLSINGWGNRAVAIVIDPEIEAWIWSDSPEVAMCLGFRGNTDQLREWIQNKGWWDLESQKPRDPKRVLNEVLRHVMKPRSSVIFQQLGQRVSLRRCTDPSFHKFRETLQSWFG